MRRILLEEVATIRVFQQAVKGENPLGKRLTLTFFPNVTRKIVGIVGNTKLESLDETRPVDVIPSVP